jgi:hypothetical protein
LLRHLLLRHAIEIFGALIEVFRRLILLLLVERFGRLLELALQALELPALLHRLLIFTPQLIELALSAL